VPAPGAARTLQPGRSRRRRRARAPFARVRATASRRSLRVSHAAGCPTAFHFLPSNRLPAVAAPPAAPPLASSTGPSSSTSAIEVSWGGSAAALVNKARK